VYHGDFEPRNIVVRKGEPVLIDFSHSQYHDCPGDNCDELEHARDVLGQKLDASQAILTPPWTPVGQPLGSPVVD